MKLTRRDFVASTAATALIGLRPALAADEKVVRFGMPQDFTKIYTFVTAEYSQGQRDYFSLVNGRGGVGGYKILADVSDHANDLPRAIEAYETAERPLRAQILRYRMRDIQSNDETSAGRESAETWLKAQGIVAPTRWAGMYAPGFAPIATESIETTF